MNPVIEEWLEKAEEDFNVAQRENRVRKNPGYNAVCFHAQQCVEKYIKGFMQKNNISFGKTHDLLKLMEAVIPIDPEWIALQDDFEALTQFGVLFRYPGERADKAIARDCVQRMKRARKFIRQKLGLE